MAKVDFNTKKLASKVIHNAEAFIRKVVLDGLTNLIRQSPVDTGRFKANWSTSVTAIESGEVDMAGSKTPLNEKSSSVDFARSIKGISAYKLGQTMFLHNNLQYALSLEYGTSEQAGRGWIRNTGIEMQKKLDGIKDLI
ncbi:MAG: hypothetical protein ABIH42_09435 [Planctomycetota bacterium]